MVLDPVSLNVWGFFFADVIKFIKCAGDSTHILFRISEEIKLFLHLYKSTTVHGY